MIGGPTLHIVICYPFLDIRFLAAAALEPRWLDSIHTNVGSLGAVMRNASNGLEAELRLDAALLFAGEYDHCKQDGQPRRRRRPAAAKGLIVTGRRLLADMYGEVRVEVTLEAIGTATVAFEEVLESALTAPVYITRHKHTEIVSAGFQIALSYLEQSAKTSDAPSNDLTVRLLREGEGSPFIVVVRSDVPSDLPDGHAIEPPPSIFRAVTCHTMNLAGRVTGVWQAWLNKPTSETQWQPAVRMLCRIICQLSEVTSLLTLKSDPGVLGSYMLDDSKTEDFLRVRAGQLRRARQGEWPVAPVQAFANQHLKISAEQTVHSREALGRLLASDLAGDLSKTISRIADTPVPQTFTPFSETRPMEYQDKMRLVDLLATQALTQANYFGFLVSQADFNMAFKLERQGGWSGQPKVDALNLVDWATQKGVNPQNPQYTTLASLLVPILDSLGLDNAVVIIAILSKYRLILDPKLLEDLLHRYQVPVRLPPLAPGLGEAARQLGPEIDWRGPPDVQLQSWLQRDPPDFLALDYIIEATRNARSVCLVSVAATGATGTGVLIGRNLVLTNYHVLVPQGSGPIPQTCANSVRLSFGGFSLSGGVAEFDLDRDDPIPVFSPTDRLDFVLLRGDPQLAASPNVQIASLIRGIQPEIRSSLSILQHPYGRTMQLAPSADAVTFVDPTSGILQYVTRTAAGSSGAPCFDAAWRLVALHHAERSRPFGTIREGILIDSILKEIEGYL